MVFVRCIPFLENNLPPICTGLCGNEFLQSVLLATTLKTTRRRLGELEVTFKSPTVSSESHLTLTFFPSRSLAMTSIMTILMSSKLRQQVVEDDWLIDRGELISPWYLYFSKSCDAGGQMAEWLWRLVQVCLNKISKWGVPRVGSNPTLLKSRFFAHLTSLEYHGSKLSWWGGRENVLRNLRLRWDLISGIRVPTKMVPPPRSLFCHDMVIARLEGAGAHNHMKTPLSLHVLWEQRLWELANLKESSTPQ